MYRRYGKRLFDLAVSLTLVVLLLPVMLLVAILVRLFLGCDVLFRQERPGLNGNTFTLLKFRTMRDAYDASGRLLSDGERLTPFGRFLRSTSLDELPELIHVIKGEMSLVGPRPLLVAYLDRYTLEQRRRHDVLPGITGLAQVNGRNAISWDARFALDLWYVEHYSLWLDLQILQKTALKVLQRTDITQAGHATVEEFCGHAPQIRGDELRSEP